jgi:hypothetical protein
MPDERGEGKMLTERLRAVADNAAQLPPEARDRLAEQFASVVVNARWDAQVRDPQHLKVLRGLAEEARRGLKLPMPTPRDTSDESLIKADDPAVLMDS